MAKEKQKEEDKTVHNNPIMMLLIGKVENTTAPSCMHRYGTCIFIIINNSMMNACMKVKLLNTGLVAFKTIYLDGCERRLVEPPEEAFHLLPLLHGHPGSRPRRRALSDEEKTESHDEGDQARWQGCHWAPYYVQLLLIFSLCC